MTLKSGLQIGIGSAVSIFFAWLIFRSIPTEEVSSIIQTINLGWAGLAVLMFLMGYVIRVFRWKSMLTDQNPAIKWGTCAIPFFVSIAANNVLPLRAGDVLRTVSFSEWLGVPSSTVLATMLVERLLDLLVVLVALGLALKLLDVEHKLLSGMLHSGSVVLIGGAFAIAAILLFPKVFEPIIMRGIALIERIVPKVSDLLSPFVTNTFRTLRELGRGPRMVKLLAWSILAWSFEALLFFIVALSIPGMEHPEGGWLAMPVGTLSTLLPSAPGYIGTLHYFVIAAAEMTGNTKAAASAYAILVHAILWVTATLVGGVSCIFWMQRRPPTPVSRPESGSNVGHL